MIVDAVRLPEDVEQGAQGGPVFKTTIITGDSGREIANQNWEMPRGAWQVGYGMRTKALYTETIKFYMARRGMARGFLFKDWTDFEMARMQIGTGNGVTLNFPIIKTYDDTVIPFQRRIFRPRSSTILVWVDGVLNGAYTLGTGGVIQFLVAPANTKVVEVSCEFDLPVRFATDQLVLQVTWVDAATVPDLQIVEVRE